MPSIRGWESLRVVVGPLGLHVARANVDSPRAQPALLLHGLGVSGQVWTAFGRRLAPEWQSIAPDLRGHGQSDHPPGGYRPLDYARDLVGLVDALDLAPVPVIGHSLGALVALALGELRPDHVSALVLVDPPLDRERRNRDVPEVYSLRKQPAPVLEEYLLSTNPGGGWLLAASLAAQFRAAADEAFEVFLDAPPGNPELWALAPKIQAPTLVVQGDPAHGALLGDTPAAAFTALLPHGRHVKIPGSTHAVHASQPAALAQAVRQFLAEHRARRV